MKYGKIKITPDRSVEEMNGDLINKIETAIQKSIPKKKIKINKKRKNRFGGMKILRRKRTKENITIGKGGN